MFHNNNTLLLHSEKSSHFSILEKKKKILSERELRMLWNWSAICLPSSEYSVILGLFVLGPKNKNEGGKW